MSADRTVRSQRRFALARSPGGLTFFNILLRLALVLILLLSETVVARGQGGATAQLSGGITDPSGAVVLASQALLFGINNLRRMKTPFFG